MQRCCGDPPISPRALGPSPLFPGRVLPLKNRDSLMFWFSIFFFSFGSFIFCCSFFFRYVVTVAVFQRVACVVFSNSHAAAFPKDPPIDLALIFFSGEARSQARFAPASAECRRASASGFCRCIYARRSSSCSRSSVSFPALHT